MRHVLVGLFVLGCSGHASSPQTSTGDLPKAGEPGGSATVEKQPKTMTLGSTSKPSFERGVALTPASQLVAWLEQQKRGTEPRLVRVPIVMPKGQYGYDQQATKLGTAPDAPAVMIDDTALGISLAMKARKCTGDVCAFLVEAYWLGKTTDGIGDGKRNVLKVVKADNPLSPEALAAITHAEVEGPSGN
ncbi:MAG TPA: hypothetical protein VFQ53_01725 [Kofleriaceae bacterium]|nr:hypothetical protein [Kofleriaceae bacterium]